MSMAASRNNRHSLNNRLPFFVAAILCALLIACGQARAANTASNEGPTGTCAPAGDPAFRDLLKMKYVRYAEAVRQDRGEDNLVMNGNDGVDDFFMNRLRKYVSLAGKGGNDFYFLPVLGSYLKIREKPAKGEINTLVITDMMDPARTPPAVMRTGNNLMIWQDQDDVPGNIVIKNWFGRDPASQAPVSCFVFLPDLKIYGPDDVAGWLRRYDDIIARRKAAPPQVLHVPMAQTYPKPGSIAAQQIPAKPRPAIPQRVFGALPANTIVASIGVQESDALLENAGDTDGTKYGSITVNVWKYDAPVVLYLTSYEPVHWIINKSKFATIKGIILGGIYRQSVESNTPGVPLRNLSGPDQPMLYTFPYGASRQASQAATISIITGLPAGNVRHQVAYQASAFDIE